MKSLHSCLWFDGNGEDAARFYISLLPNSSIDTSSARPAIIRRARRGACSSSISR